MQLETTVTTTVVADAIVQRVYLEYPFDREHVMSCMIDLMDDRVRRSLIALVWTPPGAH